MVALLIGMIGMLVIMQVARTTEAQKRVTTGSGDAQNNAALAIYSVERHLKQAGYGFSSLEVIGCAMRIHDEVDDPMAPVSPKFVPVVINPPNAILPSGDAGADTLLVIHGSSASLPEGSLIVSTESKPASLPGSSDQRFIGLESVTDFREDELVIAAPVGSSGSCELALLRILDTDPSGYTIEVSTSPYGTPTEDRLLFNLGAEPKVVGYAVRGGNLTVCDYMLAECTDADDAGWIPVANGIISLRAQYRWDTGAWNQTAPAKREDWAKISAVRIALLARNSEPDKENVTTAALSWAGGSIDPAALTDAPPPAGLTWQNYRYQVYETVVPLRNIPWMGS
jgi:type IV pilus assembly protein PilW